MDYIGRTMNICLILFMISITGSRCQYYSNRDIILTPNHLKTYPGKVLYYRPRDHAPPHNQENDDNGAVPWEEVLKETVFLALNDNKTSHQQQPSGSTLDNAPLLAKRQQKAIYSAPYIGAVDLSVPRFGDIVELAHGRLEREGEDGESSYFFVQQQEGDQQRHSKRNVSALWMVERIRHRDDLRGHRYELKFTVTPVVRTTSSNNNNMTNAIDNEMQSESYEGEELAKVWNEGNRTFIIRDEDYPKYFGAILPPNANIPMMHRKNDQAMFDRTFFDLQPQHSYGGAGSGAAFPPATRFFRPAAVQPQQTITLGQYLVQSLLSGGETPKYHHHQHHMVPTKYAPFPGIYGATSNRIKFPDSFNTASQNVPKYYHHIHFPRPSIAPLAPTALPGSFLIQHAKDSPAPVAQDYTKLADHRGAAAINAAISGPDSLEARPNNVQQVIHKPSSQPAPVQNGPQQQQQQQQKQRPLQFTPHQSQVPTTPYGAAAHQTPTPQQQQQTPPHIIYRQQPQQQQQQQPPFMIHPNAPHPPFAGPFLQPIHAPPPHASHLIQSIPFYNPQGQMVLNHIPVMSNHHLIQMSPPQPIAIPVHVQLIPPPHLYASAPQHPQHPQHQQQQQQPSPTHPQQQQQQQPQQDGLQAIPVRIMQPFPNPVHLYSPVHHPFLHPLPQSLRHPIVTVTPKTITTTTATSTTNSNTNTITNLQHFQHHPHPSTTSSSTNHSSSSSAPSSPAGPGPHPHPHQQHPHPHPHPHPHSLKAHSFNALPTVFKFTSSNAIHPQKVAGGSAVTGGPTVPTTNRHTPLVQLSGPSIGPSTPHQHQHQYQQQQRHRFSATPTASTATRGSSSTAPITFPSSAVTPTRPSVRYTSAIGQVSGPTAASSIAANHRYSPSSAASASASLPTVPASPAGLREKFTATAAFQQPAASESKQSARKLEPPAPSTGASASSASSDATAADAAGSSPSNAVSPKYESFGVENAVTPTNSASIATASTPAAESLLLRSPSSTASSSFSPSSTFGVSVSHHSPASSSYGTASPAARPSSYGTTSAFSYSNFIDASGAVSVTGKLVSEPVTRSRPATSGATQSTTPFSVHPTTQATFVPKPKSYIQQLGPTIGVKYPPAFKSMPSVTILPPQIETPISSTLKTYQYLNHHHDTYDFIPSRVVELAHVKKMAGQKHAKRNKQKAGGKHAPGSKQGGSQGNHHMPPQQHQPQPQQHQPQPQQHHHVTVTSNKPLRFYPGEGPEFATHRPEAQLSVQLPPPEKEFPMTYYGTPKHNQKVQRPKNYVTPLHYQAPSSTTPMPAAASTPAASSTVSSTVAPPQSASLASTTPEPSVPRNTSASTFRSATASSTAHYYKNRHEKSDDLSITTMRPRMILKTIYRQFPGSFVSTSTMTSASTEKPIQKWVPKRPRTKSTSGEYSTSTLPSSNRGSDPVAASSDHSPDVVTKNPVVPSVTVQQTQMSPRARASRGRSRYTYRRIPSGNPPPIPTGQQAIRIGRMRNGGASSSSTTTTTIKPVPVVTSSVFDSNRIDTRSFEQQERKAEETVMETTTPVEKIKRDATEELVDELAVADQMVAKQVAENKHDALEINEPEKEYVMVKANVTPVNTNEPNVVFFEASDATVSASGAGAGVAATVDSSAGRSLGSAIEDLTMSIINHAKAIVNQTEQESEVPETTTAATTTTSSATTSKSVESNEISQKEMPQETIDTTENEIDADMISHTESATSHGVTESASETTIATTPATTLDDVELRDDDDAEDTKRTTVKEDLSN